MSDDLWRQVHERLASMEKPFTPLKGAVRGRTSEPRYLLTGLAKCGVCGGSMVTSVTGRYPVYRCGYNTTRGSSVCPNSAKVRTEVADAAVLTALLRDALTTDVVDAALDLALHELGQPDLAETARREALKGELVRIENELGKYAEAIAAAGPMDSILNSIKIREARRHAICGELKALKPPKAAAERNPHAIRADLVKRLADWRALARCAIGEARQVLRVLLLDRMTLTPVPGPADWKPGGPGRKPRRVYRFTARLTLASLFDGLIWAQPLVAPTGFEPVFSD